MAKVTKDTMIGELLQIDENVAPMLLNIGMHCLGCPSSQMETIAEAAMVHGIDPDDLVNDINDFIEHDATAQISTIDKVERLAHVLVNYYNGRNDLFKNEKKNRFYLVIHKDDHTPEEFNKVCNIICEYAQQKNYNPAVGAYFAEHGNKITGPQALQVFASLQKI